MDNSDLRMETTGCPVCNCRENQVLFYAKDNLLGHSGSFREVKCLKCGLIYINPPPPLEDMSKYYKGNYAPHIKKAKPARKRSGILKRLRERLYREGDLRTKLKKDAYSGPKGKILDVGCGGGAFLVRLNSLGWETYGVEIDPAASQVAREYGIQVKTGTLEKAQYPDSYFNVITAIHVLEHIHNPLRFMAEIYRILKPGGILYIEVPNTSSHNFRRFGKEWFHLDAPRHLCSYSPRSLRCLLEKCGFQLRRLRYLSGSVGLRGSIQYDRRARNLSQWPWIDRKIIRRIMGLAAFFIDFARQGDVIRVDALKGPKGD